MIESLENIHDFSLVTPISKIFSLPYGKEKIGWLNSAYGGKGEAGGG